MGSQWWVASSHDKPCFTANIALGMFGCAITRDAKSLQPWCSANKLCNPVEQSSLVMNSKKKPLQTIKTCIAQTWQLLHHGISQVLAFVFVGVAFWKVWDLRRKREVKHDSAECIWLFACTICRPFELYSTRKELSSSEFFCSSSLRLI